MQNVMSMPRVAHVNFQGWGKLFAMNMQFFVRWVGVISGNMGFQRGNRAVFILMNF